MQARLLKRLGSPSDSGAPTADDLTYYLNVAYLDILDRFRFHKARQRCRFNTIAGTSRYSIPTEAKAIFRLMNVTRGYKLSKRGDRFLSSNSPATDLTNLDETVIPNIPPSYTWGPPTEYIRYRDYMELSPIPDSVYTMEVFYKYDVPELVDLVDAPAIARSWHHGIVLLATWYYYDEQKDQPKKQDALSTFMEWVSTKPNEIDEESVDIDTAAEVPTLSSSDPRLDFSHAD
jgi:hypothetical protein